VLRSEGDQGPCDITTIRRRKEGTFVA